MENFKDINKIMNNINFKIKKMLKKYFFNIKPNELFSKSISNTDYWTRHNVTNHLKFSSKQQSLDYLDWRNTQYLDYEKLMPCLGQDSKVILDYGCGPGHDLVGFLEFSKPKSVYAADISTTSLEESKQRLAFHKSDIVEFILLKNGQKELPFKDDFFDYIHCSGVLHHTPNIEEILREFYRILKPRGVVRIMVYNYDSIWLHLYVAYKLRLVDQIILDEPIEETFRKSTDGFNCPISRYYKKDIFLNLCRNQGFYGKFLGSAISLHEMSLLPLRYEALQNPALLKEHRDFLKNLNFDRFARPIYNNEVAGIDAFYEFTKTN